jgi:hypothetical protein
MSLRLQNKHQEIRGQEEDLACDLMIFLPDPTPIDICKIYLSDKPFGLMQINLLGNQYSAL